MQQEAGHVVRLYFNFKSVEVTPLTDVRRKTKKLQLKKWFRNLPFYFVFPFIAFVRSNEGIIMLAAEHREVN